MLPNKNANEKENKPIAPLHLFTIIAQSGDIDNNNNIHEIAWL